MPWYLYTPITFPPDTCNPNNYTLVGVLPPSCPSPNNFLCAIQASDIMGLPNLTFALMCEISTALQGRIDTTNVKLKP